MIAALHDVLTWSLALALCVPGWRGRGARALAVPLAIAALLHAPLAGSTPIAALRGLFAEPSVSALVVLAALFGARAGLCQTFAPGERLGVAALVALSGVLFYPPALGLGAVDPYAWGYAGAALALAAGALAVAAALCGRWVIAAAPALALVAWRLEVLASPNLWDYLLDPLLAVAGLVALPLLALSKARGSAKRSANRAGRTPAAARSAANSAPPR